MKSITTVVHRRARNGQLVSFNKAIDGEDGGFGYRYTPVGFQLWTLRVYVDAYEGKWTEPFVKIDIAEIWIAIDSSTQFHAAFDDLMVEVGRLNRKYTGKTVKEAK